MHAAQIWCLVITVVVYCLFVFFWLHQENIVEVEVQVDPKYHRHFIQRRGQVCVCVCLCVGEERDWVCSFSCPVKYIDLYMHVNSWFQFRDSCSLFSNSMKPSVS